MLGVERLRLVALQLRVARLDQREAGLFDVRQDLSNQPSLDGIGFDDEQGALDGQCNLLVAADGPRVCVSATPVRAFRPVTG